MFNFAQIGPDNFHYVNLNQQRTSSDRRNRMINRQFSKLFEWETVPELKVLPQVAMECETWPFCGLYVYVLPAWTELFVQKNINYNVPCKNYSSDSNQVNS